MKSKLTWVNLIKQGQLQQLGCKTNWRTS